MRQVACVVAGEWRAGETPVLHKIKIRATIDFPEIFTSTRLATIERSASPANGIAPRNRDAPNPAIKARQAGCTKSGHPLVERLHSVVCKRDKSGHFLLTIKMKGVKTNSFFDTF
jgi:hypothetical protein